jgi:uncharacterized Zn-binding protein involved in type VI secretion
LYWGKKMAQLSRVGDMNLFGGKIINGAKTVIANGKQVGLHPSLITPHFPFKKLHLLAFTTGGSPTVFAEGKPVLKVGTSATCGHSIVIGSPNVFVP